MAHLPFDFFEVADLPPGRFIPQASAAEGAGLSRPRDGCFG